MWEIILKIFSVLGIILLVLLGLLILILFILLFYPITYKGEGQKNQNETYFRFRATWLFGLIRAKFFYPDPGKFEVKALWMTLYPKKEKVPENKNDIISNCKNEITISKEDDLSEKKTNQTIIASDKVNSEEPEENTQDKKSNDSNGSNDIRDESKNLFQKIKYTIHTVYGKIKTILKNISFYYNLLQEQNTVDLWNHVKLRLIKVLKSIRPRHLYADIVFGTGEPDTTGYAFAAYGMLSPYLGKNVSVTPDFEEKILKGNLKFSGHITLFIVLWHCLMVVTDKKLHIFLESIKSGRK